MQVLYLMHQIFMRMNYMRTNQLAQDLCNFCASFHPKLDAEILIAWEMEVFSSWYSKTVFYVFLLPQCYLSVRNKLL